MGVFNSSFCQSGGFFPKRAFKSRIFDRFPFPKVAFLKPTMSRGKSNYLQKGNLFYPPFAPLCCPPAPRRQPNRSAFSSPSLSLFRRFFFLFFFFFFSQFKSEVRKAVFFSIEVSGHLSPSSETGFSSVVFLLYPPCLLSFQRFSTRSRGLCTRFLFPDFLWIFSLVSEERAEE